MINKELIKNISSNPGVYYWKDKDENIIYIGKAKNLKARMKQYFDISMKNSYKTQKMLDEIASFETFVFNTENEALIFERSSIAKYKPKFNVIFPIQSTFPYLCISKKKNNIDIKLRNSYKKDPNAIYYGPLVKGDKYKELIKYLIHLLKSKDGMIIKKMTPSEVEQTFLKAKKLLRFDTNFKNDLTAKMYHASNNLDYQSAYKYKQILDLLYNKENKQDLVLKTKKDIDVFGFYILENKVFISIMHYRYSNLINKSDFYFNINGIIDDFVINFIEEYYSKNQLPASIVLSPLFKNLFLGNNLKSHLIFSDNYPYKKMLAIASENAKNDIENKVKILEKNNKLESVISTLSYIIGNKVNNFVIFDNSFMTNTNEIVGGCFVYKDGVILSRNSRAFILKKEYGASDAYYMYQNAYKFLKNYAELVDVIFVDGGIIQINSVKEALFDLGISKPVFGLVKNEFHMFKKLINDKNKDLEITDLEVFKFLTKIQTSIDKYAKKWYQKRHSKSMVYTPLENIKGITKEIINKLLDYFITYDNIYQASLEELKKVIPERIAKKIKNAF